MAPSQEYLNAYGTAAQGYEAQTADAAGNPIEQHVHHSYIWLGTLRVALIILIVALFSVGSSVGELLASGSFITRRELFAANAIIWGAVVAYLVFVALMFVYQKISYKHLYFTLEPTEFSLYKGILNKQRVHVPYTRVQSVDQKATLIQRILGVCNVHVDTAGGASNKSILIPYMTKAQAIWLRSELFLRKQAAVEGIEPEQLRTGSSPASDVSHDAADNVLEVGNQVWDEFGNGVFSGAAYDSGTVTCEYGLTNKELIFTGLSNNAGFVAVVMMVIVALLQVFDAVFQLFPDQGEWLIDSAYRGAQALPFMGAMIIAIGVIVMLVIIWALSIVGTLISFGGFRARRRGTRIEVERGLLQHIYTGVDIDRVQAVVVKQTLIRRLIGYCELSLSKIDAEASEDEAQNKSLNQQGLVIHPFLKLSRVEEVLKGIVPEYAGAPEDVQHVPKVALRRALIRRCIWQGGGFWLAVIVAAIQVILYAAWPYTPGIDLDIVDTVCIICYIVAALIFAAEVIDSIMWARESGFSHNRDFIRILNGGFSRTTADILRRKIQYGSVKTNPLQRRAHTATLNVRTAAGVGGTTVRLIDVQADAADEYLDWLKPRR